MNVTILGSGPSHKYCEYRPGELWGCLDNLINPEIGDKPYTLLFAFDGLECVYNGEKKPNNILKASLDIAHDRKIPVVSDKEYADIPFPSREIVRRFHTAFFMPTVSFMIAYALYKDYSPVYIHGIDGGPGWEYQFGKPHITHWLGVACGNKTEIVLGKGSLSWAYSTGLKDFPREIIVRDTEQIGIKVSEYVAHS